MLIEKKNIQTTGEEIKTKVKISPLPKASMLINIFYCLRSMLLDFCYPSLNPLNPLRFQ